jgi:putative glutamine amidotransferase
MMKLRQPLIGLNPDYRPSEGSPGTGHYFLSDGYFRALLDSGAVPIVIPPLDDAGELDRVLDLLDGVMLIGGRDLDPRRDGFMLHPSNRLLDPRREAFDRRLAAAIVRRRIPVYGIGAGMQLLNVTLGGNLFLHLPEDLPKAIAHFDPTDPAHRHALEVQPGSLMAEIYGDGEIRVSSTHHMALDEVAPGFAVTARCPDGVIEAIESTDDDWFALGTQFHPEKPYGTALDIRIVEEFVAGVRDGQRVRIAA